MVYKCTIGGAQDKNGSYSKADMMSINNTHSVSSPSLCKDYYKQLKQWVPPMMCFLQK